MPIPTAALRQQVTIEAFTGDGALGPTFSAAGPLTRCRIVGKRRAVRTRAGVDVISSASIIFRPDVSAPAESRITHGADTYTVLDVAPSEELTRPHSLTVLVEGPR